MNAGGALQNLLHLLAGGQIARDRRSVGQPDGGNKDSLILVGKKSSRELLEKQTGAKVNGHHRNYRQQTFPNQPANTEQIAVCSPGETQVEFVEKPIERPSGFAFRL